MIRLKTQEDLEKLRVSGKILAQVLKELTAKAKEGVNLLDLDAQARKRLWQLKARPSFLGFQSKKNQAPFPGAICASLNEVIVHSPPYDYCLKSGDLLKLDLGVDYQGYFTDCAITVGIGQISKNAWKLLATTELALKKAIKLCWPGNTLGDIGWVIENTARKSGFSVVEKLTGHGTGFAVHEAPSVPNYGEKGQGQKLETGLVIAIEPMFSAGQPELKEKEDGGFAVADGSFGAHFEHTIAITEKGPEVLTNL